MCENLRKSKTSFSRSIFLNRKSQNIKRHNTFWWFMRFLCGTNNWEKPIFTTIYLLIVPQSLNINGILFSFFYITNSLFWYRISYFQTRNFSPFFFYMDIVIIELLFFLYCWLCFIEKMGHGQGKDLKTHISSRWKMRKTLDSIYWFIYLNNLCGWRTVLNAESKSIIEGHFYFQQW